MSTESIKPWQIITLIAVCFAFLTYWIGTLIPENLFVAIGMALLTVIGANVLPSKRSK